MESVGKKSRRRRSFTAEFNSLDTSRHGAMGAADRFLAGRPRPGDRVAERCGFRKGSESR